MRLVLQEPSPNRGDSEGREGPPVQEVSRGKPSTPSPLLRLGPVSALLSG